MLRPPTTLVDICREHAQKRGDRNAYGFVADEEIRIALSFEQLDQASRNVAGFLQQRCEPGDRVLLMLESGLDFVRAFFGCLYAGVVAVPVNLPSAVRHVATVQGIARDAGARLVLASATALEFMTAQDELLECIAFDASCADEPHAFYDPNLTGRAPAFLQYTSGSTGSPKGVVVTHENILANMAMIKAGFGHSDETVGAGWLPLTHDMGLVGLVLQPAYLGISSILMSPLSFVRKPIRWLQIISKYRVTTSGGPDFAYNMCVRRLEDGDLEGLDLSSWRVAFNGAEPIRRHTMDAFARKFARAGFSAKAFYPCYGLAEATLFVTGPRAGEGLKTRRVSADALEDGAIPEQDVEEGADRVRELVACGGPWEAATVQIVNPETRDVVGTREIGEIWVRGANIAQGYWGNREATQQSFEAYTSDGQGPFLRTGDLGFLESGALYVTGRIKDVLIVSGKNHYPQDIELTASQSHPILVGRPGAAFLLTEQGREILVLIQEVPKQLGGRRAQSNEEPLVGELKMKICDAVAREHGLSVRRLLFVPQGALPMTTSGKIQRSLSRRLLIANQFRAIDSGQELERGIG